MIAAIRQRYPRDVLLIGGAVVAVALLRETPGYAVVLGLLFASLGRSATIPPALLGKRLLGSAIVGLGATLQFQTVIAVSAETLGVTIVAIAATLIAGVVVGRLLGVGNDLRILIAAGTAICGASAIGAVAAARQVSSDIIVSALAVIVALNTVALFLFPAIGSYFGMSPDQFAVFAGLAIHDTSSVVGAALAFEPSSVDRAVTVKLARAVWIAPLVVLSSVRGGAARWWQLPWFLWGFLVMSLIASTGVVDASSAALIRSVARAVFAAALFYLGASVSWGSLRAMGFRPMLLGVVLWALATVIAIVWLRTGGL